MCIRVPYQKNPPFMATSHLRILLEGQLQGLNFRLNTQEQARQLHLVGFVRHLADGRIEIDAQGDKKLLEKLLAWCQDKPHAAKITSIFYLYDNELTNSSNDFTVRKWKQGFRYGSPNL